jgi:hypothetical protein
LSLLLLIGAGLFLQSLRNLKTLNPGFDVRNLLALDVNPTLNRSDTKWIVDYYRRLRDRLNAVPGVESHTFAVVPVLEDNEWDNWVTIEGYSAKQDERPDPHMQYCSPGFFQTLKIPVILGRDFTDRDIAGAPKVGIVNQKFVKRYFGGADPLGRHVGMGIDPGTKTDIQIVGVVGDAVRKYARFPTNSTFPPPSELCEQRHGLRARRRRPGPSVQYATHGSEAVDAGVPVYVRTVSDQVEISLLTERLLARCRASDVSRRSGRARALKRGLHGGAPRARSASGWRWAQGSAPWCDGAREGSPRRYRGGVRLAGAYGLRAWCKRSCSESTDLSWLPPLGITGDGAGGLRPGASGQDRSMSALRWE